MSYHTVIYRYFIDEVSGLLRGMRESFWEVADRTERARVRLKLLRHRDDLRRRELLDYRQIGMTGFELLMDGVSVIRTPDATTLLDDIQRLIAAQQATDRRLLADLIEFSQHDWQRLARYLECGDAVFRSVRLGGDTPQSSWIVGASPPPGLCLAIERNGVLHQISEGLVYQHGDVLLNIVPVSAVLEWESWAGETSTDSVDKLGTTVLKTPP